MNGYKLKFNIVLFSDLPIRRAAASFTDVLYGLPAHGFLADGAGTETRGQASAAPATRPPCFSRPCKRSAEGAEVSKKEERGEVS